MDDFDALSVLPAGVRQRVIDYRAWKAQRISEIGKEAFDAEQAHTRAAEETDEAAKKARERSIELLEKSGLKDDVERCRFDNFETTQDWQRKMFDMCQAFIKQDESKFLYLSGQPGCGKTHLGTAVCGHFISMGYSTVYAIHAAMLKDLKAHVNEDDYDETQAHYIYPKVLYLDDFMKPAKDRDGKLLPPTGPDITHSFEAINLRMIQRKITIITSERSLEEIIQIDEALGSRIKQMCGEYTLNITRKDGRNWRLKGDRT